MISGRVTKVGFRLAAVKEARELELVGWVRNTEDGRVEIVAEGERQRLVYLVAWAKRGPFLARVSNVEVLWEEPTGEFEDFEALE